MSVILAEKTLAAIESALKADQGARFRRELGRAVTECDDAFRGEEEFPFRNHLGASILGRDCPRQLWYTFRWAKRAHHIGRTIRLFNRGHLEEARFVALLRMIDYKIWQIDSNGKQFRISHFGGHYGSAIDGVIGGCLEIPNQPGITEFKTYNDKNFQKLKKEGVRSAKFEHYVQMQQYCGYYRIGYALYVAVNKNDDELYAEIIYFDPENYAQYLDRAQSIIATSEGPIRPFTSAQWTCKLCEYRDICHKGFAPERNCRTCRYSQAWADGTWHCQLYNCELDKFQQFNACNSWDMIPGLANHATSQLPDFSGGLSLGALHVGGPGERSSGSSDGDG